ncbi:hypothetical protein P0F65_10160 [Sphingomonas sp. I4]
MLAFYYPWYGNPATSGKWSHWQGPKNEAPRQSPTLNHPRLGLYDSHDPAVIRTHFAQMKAAGITALIVSWWGSGRSRTRRCPRSSPLRRRWGCMSPSIWNSKGWRDGRGAGYRLSDPDLRGAWQLAAGRRAAGTVPLPPGTARPACARLAQGGGAGLPGR